MKGLDCKAHCLFQFSRRSKSILVSQWNALLLHLIVTLDNSVLHLQIRTDTLDLEGKVCL